VLSRARPADVPDSVYLRVGQVAANVWHVLQRDGPQSLAQLQQKVTRDLPLLQDALGWLARAEKVVIIHQQQTLRVLLK